MLSKSVFASPIGHIEVTTVDDQLNKIDFVEDSVELLPPNTSTLQTIVNQLQHYFEDPSASFNMIYDQIGTSFQQRVWFALTQISVGKTLTYGELAKKLETGPRAIGQACRTNALPILVPCHRVVAANHIGGFVGNIRGRYAAIKTWLLEHEKRFSHRGE